VNSLYESRKRVGIHHFSFLFSFSVPQEGVLRKSRVAIYFAALEGDLKGREIVVDVSGQKGVVSVWKASVPF
jgi:hypothetical protein